MVEPDTKLSEEAEARSQLVFLFLSGFFISAMTMLNVIGITKFIEFGPLSLAVGVLPYPLTFLCTDLVCELYGKKRANQMVTTGLVMNLFIIGTLWLGNALPAAANPAPWQTIYLSQDLPTPDGSAFSGSVELFTIIYTMSSGAVLASMLAYIAAQYIDVRLFHFFKNLTKGKHLWLRNNCSTLISQGVDSFMVISVTFGAAVMAGQMSWRTFFILMGSNYLFKFCSALFDTPFFYFFTWKLKKYIHGNADQAKS